MALVLAVMHLHKKKNSLIASVHSFFFYPFLKSVIDKSTEWSMLPACPSLVCFFNRCNIEGTNSFKILC